MILLVLGVVFGVTTTGDALWLRRLSAANRNASDTSMAGNADRGLSLASSGIVGSAHMMCGPNTAGSGDPGGVSILGSATSVTVESVGTTGASNIGASTTESVFTGGSS
jgi:hypothetical protein